MSDAVPYSKVTIIIEEGNKTTTIRVPKAKDISFENAAVPAERLVGSGPFQYETDISKLKLELTSLFDDEKQHLYLIETSTLGEPV